MGILIRWLMLTISVMVASYLLEGVQVNNFFSAFFAAAALGFMNAFFRPILLILTLPINILSLGLFTFIINAVLIKMASGLIPGFQVLGFWTAIFAALIISVVNFILEALFRNIGSIPPGGPGRGAGPRYREDLIDLERKPGGRWE